MINTDFSNLSQDQATNHKIIDKTFESNNHERELGTLGKFFGSGDTVKMNISGLTILVLIITGICYTTAILCFDTTANSKAVGISDFWGIISPMITLALGFIFGKTQK